MMSVGTSVRVIIAILLTQNLLTKCEDSQDIDHGPQPFPMGHLDQFGHMDHLDHDHHIEKLEHSYHIGELDHSDLLDHFDAVGGSNPELMSNMLQSSGMSKQILNNNNSNNIIRRVDVVLHNGDSTTKYETTHHNNDMFDETLIPSLSPSNKPIGFTKVVKKTVIKRGGKNGEQSSALESSRSMNEMFGNGNLNAIGTDNEITSKSRIVSQINRMENNRMPPMSVQQGSELSSDLQNAIRTTVTKSTTTSGGDASNDLGSRSAALSLVNSIPSNNVMSRISSSNSDYGNSVIIDGLRSSSTDGYGRVTSMPNAPMMGMNGPNGMPRGQQMSRKPAGSFVKTTIIKHETTHDDDYDDHVGDFDEHGSEFNEGIVKHTNNIVATMNPSGYNQLEKTSTVGGDNFNTDTQIGSISPWKQKNYENKSTRFTNSLSQSGTSSQTNHEPMAYSGLKLSDNQGLSRQTQTSTVRQQGANDQIDYNNLNGQMIGFNSNDGIGQLNDKINSNYFITSTSSTNQDNNGIMSTNNMEQINGFMPGGYTLIKTQGDNGNGFRKRNGNRRTKKAKSRRSKKVLVKKITYNTKTKSTKKNSRRNGSKSGRRYGGKNGGINGKKMGVSGGMSRGMSGGMSGGSGSGSGSSGGRSGDSGIGSGSGSISSGGTSVSRSGGGSSGGGSSGSGSGERKNMAITARSTGQKNVGRKSYSSKMYAIKSPETSTFSKSYAHESNTGQQQGYNMCNCNGQRSLNQREVIGGNANASKNHGPTGSDDDRFPNNPHIQLESGDSMSTMQGFPDAPVFFNKPWNYINSNVMKNSAYTSGNAEQSTQHMGGPPGPGPQFNHSFGSHPFYKSIGGQFRGSPAADHQPPPPLPPHRGPGTKFGNFKNSFSKMSFGGMMPPAPPPQGFMHNMQSFTNHPGDQMMDGIDMVSSQMHHQMKEDRSGSGRFGFKQIVDSANLVDSAGLATMMNAHGSNAMMSNTNGGPIVSGYTKITKTTNTIDGENGVPEMMNVARFQSMVPATGSYSDDDHDDSN